MRKQISYILLVFVLVITLCAGMTGFYGRQNSYIRLDQIYVGSVGLIGMDVLSRNFVMEVEDSLRQIPVEEYRERYQVLASEIQQLEEYCTVLQIEQSGKGYYIDSSGLVYSYSEEEVNQIRCQFDYSMERSRELIAQKLFIQKSISQALSYGDYVAQIHEQANKMLRCKVFSQKLVSRIIKTDRDFYGRENIRIVATTGAGFIRLFSSKVGVLCGILGAIGCAFVMTGSSKEQQNGKNLLYGRYRKLCIPIVILGFLGIFMMEALVSDMHWKLEDFSIPIQSLQTFRTSHFMLSLGDLLGISILFKIAGCLIVFFLMQGILSMKKKWEMLLFITSVGVISILLNLMSPAISPFSIFCAEKVFGKYHNINLLGIQIAPAVVQTIMTVLLLLVSYVFSARQIEGAILLWKEETEKRIFEDINHKYNETRMIRHDMNNHLTAISYLLSNGKNEEALNYVREITDELENTRCFVRTGRDALDALIANKATIAKQEKINLCMDFSIDLRESAITDYELCSLFGNLLDNAIEAVGRCESVAREISVKVRRQMDMLCIFVGNPYEAIQEENGGFITLKKDKKNHGLGLKQVERIASKYKGNVSIQTAGYRFAVAVLMNDIS